jgi:hypothetical protein
MICSYMDASQVASAGCGAALVELQSYIRPVCAGSLRLLAPMVFAERILIFCASFALPNRFRLRLSRSNLFSHLTHFALRKL